MEILGFVLAFLLVGVIYEPERTGVWLRRVKNGFSASSPGEAEDQRRIARTEAKAARRRRKGKGLSQKGWEG